ncbi:unnamed protein product [Phytophthora fragariaefolia]|uniref:valine--tRNA ligase n=1 Tax=Phytophthora fragariaefolia TaxID=1490495 RepID=A0A9W6Y1X6_9STRA|nr:unnamed protein product [Phytophthora fragariaefolia]
MAKRAADNVRNGVMTIEPKSHAHTWFFFLDNIQDWCVSRQLWWGHRIPAYRLKPGTAGAIGMSDQWFVAPSVEEARKKAETELGCNLQNDDLEQDVDVLDTWFSSGLLPLSAFVSCRDITVAPFGCWCAAANAYYADRVGPMQATMMASRRISAPAIHLM